MQHKNIYLGISVLTLFCGISTVAWYTIFHTPVESNIPTYTINATSTSNGEITPSGISTITEGGSQTYSFTPRPGYKVATVIVDGASTTATSSYDFTNVTQNHTIQATFLPTYYTSDKHGIYFKDQIASGVDAKTFVVMGDYYGKDRLGVFYSSGERIPTADPVSFTALAEDSAYAIDKEYVFWASAQVFGADVETFKVLGGTYASDKNHIYYTNQTVTEADLATFSYKGEGYAQDKNMVYFLGQPFTLSKQVPVPIGFTYATNTDGVFYGGDKVQGADIKSFTALSYYYAKDKKRVYYQSGELEGASTSSFEIIPTSSTGPNVARDAKFVYSEFTPLPLNPKSVRVVGGNFVADDTAVYFTNTKVIGADPNTFTFLGFNYGVDTSGLWSGTQFVTNSTPETGERNSKTKYRYLGDAFITDGTYVYLGSRVLAGADPDTFDYIAGSPVSYDTDSLFYGNETIAVNLKNLSISGTRAAYIKTETEVFFLGIKIAGADASSFIVSDDENYASDKTGKYYKGKRLTETTYEQDTPEEIGDIPEII